jgi:hypothetical protein
LPQKANSGIGKFWVTIAALAAGAIAPAISAQFDPILPAIVAIDPAAQPQADLDPLDPPIAPIVRFKPRTQHNAR